MNILSVNAALQFDESVSGIEYRTHEAFTGSKFDNNDEIRIPIQNQDSYTLPSESFIYIEGKLTKNDGKTAVANTKLVNNAFSHLISEIRYLLNGIEIDKTRNVGYSSFLKGITSFSQNDARRLNNSGWSESDFYEDIADDGSFNIILPLNMLMGFFEDYRKILLNCKQELIIQRSANDLNSILTTPAAGEAGQQVLEKSKITITKLNWRMPYVDVADKSRLKLLDILQSDQPLLLGFRSWRMYEKPLLSTSEKIDWQVQTSTHLERPRYVILALQKNGKNKANENVNVFHNSKLRNVKLYLNGKNFPYDNLNLDMNKKRVAVLYEMYVRFRESYYFKEISPYYNISDFLSKAPIFVIDCSKQNEAIKSGSVDVRLEIEAENAFPEGTTAYCLILHDRVVEYTPLSSTVRVHV